MKSFKEFLINVDEPESDNSIEELAIFDRIKKTFSSIKKKVCGALRKLKLSFGKKKTIIISSGQFKNGVLNEESGDQSLYGYYSEICTIQHLIEHLLSHYNTTDGKAHVKLTTKSSETAIEAVGDAALSAATKRATDYKKDHKLNKKKSVVRNELAGLGLAKAIANDAEAEVDDWAFCDFIVSWTGDLGKGETTADLKLVIVKYKESKVIKTINASLKSYKGWRINLANNSVKSFLEHAKISENMKDPAILDRIVSEQNIRNDIHKVFVSFQKEELNVKQAQAAVKKLFSFATTSQQDKIWGAISSYFVEYDKERKDVYRKVVRKSKEKKYGKEDSPERDKEIALEKEWEAVLKRAVDANALDASKYLKSQITNAYKSDKTVINNAILGLLNITNPEDDFYLAVIQEIGKSKKLKMNVVSSRTSPEYKAIVEKLVSGFDLKFNEGKLNNEKISMDMTFVGPDGKIIVKAEISFGCSGSISSTKTNFWVDFGSLNIG